MCHAGVTLGRSSCSYPPVQLAAHYALCEGESSTDEARYGL